MKKSLSVILSLVMIFVSVATLFAPVSAQADEISAGTNVIGYYNDESFFDTSNFDFTDEQRASMEKSGTGENAEPILLGENDDLVTDYGSWSLTVNSTSELKGSAYKQYMPISTIDGKLYLPLPGSATAVRAVKGMKIGSEYTVSFKYRAYNDTTANSTIKMLFANSYVNCKPMYVDTNSVYTTPSTTTTWETASFVIENSYNDENGYVYIAFAATNGKHVLIDDLSIVENVYSETEVPAGKNIVGYFNSTTGEGKNSKNPYASDFDSSTFEELEANRSVKFIHYENDEDYADNQRAYKDLNDTTKAALAGKNAAKKQYGSWAAFTSGNKYHSGVNVNIASDGETNYLHINTAVSYIRAVAGFKADSVYTVAVKAKALGSNTEFLYDVKAVDENGVLWTQKEFLGNTETLTTEWQTFSFSYTAKTSGTNYLTIWGDDIAVDDISIIETPKYTVSAVSSDGYLGNVVGSGEYFKGDTVTLTATPNIAGCDVFIGWYNGEELVSTATTYTFIANEDIDLVAKFTTKNLIGKDSSVYDSSNFENVDTSDMITVLGDVYDGKPIFNAPQKNNEVVDVTASATVVTDDTGTGALKDTIAAFKNGDSYGSWLTAASSAKGKYIFSRGEAFSVKLSSETINGANNNFLIFPASYSSSRAIKGLNPATEYIFSFKYKTDVAGKSFRVGLNANKTPHLTTSTETDVVGTNSLTTTTTWQTATFKITNIADFMDEDGIVYLSVLSNLAGAYVSIDDIAVVADRTKYNVTVSSNNEAYGTVEGEGTFMEGTDVTVTATPTKEYYVFEGWYNGETKVSSNAEYTFALKADTDLTAKFISKNLIGKYNSVYDSSDFNGLDIAVNSVYNENYPVMVAPIDQVDISADPENVKEGVGTIAKDKLSNTLANAKDTNSDAYGSWFASTGNPSNPSFGYISSVMPLYVQEQTGGYVLFRNSRYYSRAIDGLQNGKKYRISFDYRTHGNTEGIVAAGFSKTKELYGTVTPSGNENLEATNTWQTASFDVYNFYTDADAMTYFTIYATQDIRFDNFAIIELDEEIIVDGEESVAISLKGVGVDKQGMRLYNRVDKNWAESSAKEYGSIAVRASRLEELKVLIDENGEFDLDLYNEYVAYVSENGGRVYGFGKGVAYTEGGEAKLWTDKCTTKVNAYTSYLTNITPKYFSEEYLVRSYAIDKNNNVVYGKIRSISIYEVIYTIRKYYSEDLEGMEAADAFIEQAINAKSYDSSVVTYEQWLESEGLSEDLESEYAQLTMYDAPTVSDSTATVLSVKNNSNPITTTFRGTSGIVHFPYTYWENSSGIGNYTQQQSDFEFDRMRDAGYKYVRAIFKDTFAWDDTEKNFNWDSTQMQYFYSWAKSLQERGMEVVLNGPYTFLSHATGEQGWTEETEYMLGYGDDLFGEAEIAGVDYNSYSDEEKLRQKKSSLRVANFITEALKQFKAHGVNNVTHILFFTEPAEISAEHILTHNLSDIYIEFLKDTNEALIRNNLRDTVKIIGPNSQQSARLTGYTIINKLLNEMDKSGKKLIDILSVHCYPEVDGLVGNNAVEEFVSGYAEDYKDFIIRFKEISAKYGWEEPEFWLDEFNVTNSEHEDGSATHEEVLKDPIYATQFAATYIRAMSYGVSNAVVWNFTNQYWPDASSPWYSNGITDSVLNSKTPYQKYYGYALLAQHLGTEGGKVYETIDLWENGLSAAFVELSDGNQVLVVVNTSTNDIKFETKFDKAIGKNMYRHIYTTDIEANEDENAIPADCGFTNVQYLLSDTIPSGAIAVYTTKIVVQ